MVTDVAFDAVFEPVQAPSTFEETVERLGTAIRLGILAPGARLPSEREMAEQLGISRSTLRQAITTLVQSGHLTSVRGRGGGTFVVQEPPLAEGHPGGALRAPPPQVLSHSNAEHARLIDALERRDPGRAVRILRRHLEGTEHILGGLTVL